MKLLTSSQAAVYISERLPNGWANPVSSLGMAVMKRQITPVLPHGPRRRYFTVAECDRFIASFRAPGKKPKDLSSIVDRLDKEPDQVLAKEIGVSAQTVTRYRKRHCQKTENKSNQEK